MKAHVLKTAWKVFVLGVAGSTGIGVFTARADLEVSGSVRIHATADFYAPLSAEGTWVEVGTYGRCWRPAGIAVDWRPYCFGHWVWTDCGWYWASDEPWGWACYHYGTWVLDPVYGWVWVPGIEWGPAWVTWRVGGGFIGWAPLPPHSITFAQPQFVFVQATRLTDPLRPSVVVVNNTTIYNNTKVVNNLKRETKAFGSGSPQKVVVNEGPGLAPFDAATARKVRLVSIKEAARQAAAPARMLPHTGVAPSKGGPGYTPGESARPGAGQGHDSVGRPTPPNAELGGPGGKGHGSEHGEEGKGHGKDQS